MLNDTGISPLSERRRMLRLVMFNKVVEEKIPALSHQEFLTPIGIKRKIKTRSVSDNYHHQNHVDKKILSAFKFKSSKTSLFRHLVILQSNYYRLEPFRGNFYVIHHHWSLNETITLQSYILWLHSSRRTICPPGTKTLCMAFIIHKLSQFKFAQFYKI